MFYHPCLLPCICLSKPSPLFLPPILFHQSWIWTSCDPASSSIFCYAEYLCVLDCISIWNIVIVWIPFGQLDTLLCLCWFKMWPQDGIALHPRSLKGWTVPAIVWGKHMVWWKHIFKLSPHSSMFLTETITLICEKKTTCKLQRLNGV